MLLVWDGNRQLAYNCSVNAALRENWYLLGVTSPPHENPGICCVFDYYTSAVFSWTWDGQKQIMYRQLGLRGRKPGTAPDMTIACTIASWYGFSGGLRSPNDAEIISGPGPDWFIDKNDAQEMLTIYQVIPPSLYS